MNNIKYGKKYHCCKNCKYLRYTHPPFDLKNNFVECELKKCYLGSYKNFLFKYKGVFCKFYENKIIF